MDVGFSIGVDVSVEVGVGVDTDSDQGQIHATLESDVTIIRYIIKTTIINISISLRVII